MIRMMFKLLSVVLAFALPGASSACVFKYGTAPDSQAPPDDGSPWDYKVFGDDWKGVDGRNQSWSCSTGQLQSPISIPAKNIKGDASLLTRWNFPPLHSDGSNLEIINTGRNIQVEWTSEYDGYMEIVADSSPGATIISILDKEDASDGTVTVTGKPIQFHFHTASEHTMDDNTYGMEMHIVSRIPMSELPGCPSTGCISVTAVLFQIIDGPDNPALNTIFSNLPLREGAINFAPKGSSISLDDVLPDQRSYYQYGGSLTTPPCSEGLLWHVMQQPGYLSLRQYRTLMMAISDKECTEQFPNRASSLAAHHKDGATHVLEVKVSELKSLHRGSDGALIMDSSPRRHLIADHDHNSESSWVCVAYAYSQNRRLPQPTNGRIVKDFKDRHHGGPSGLLSKMLIRV